MNFSFRSFTLKRMGLNNSLINQYQLNYKSDPLAKYKHTIPDEAGRFDIWLKILRQKLKNIVFLRQTYTFLTFAAPPAGENGIAFGVTLNKPPSMCVSNLGWIGPSVRDLCHFS